MSSIIRHKILQYITDRPNKVILKQDIMDELELTAPQVTACVLALQQTSTIGDEIETLTRGNAWRFVPRFVSDGTRGGRVPPRDRSRPLTQQLRDYMMASPGKVVYLDELMAYTGATEAQIKVGMNNMRSGNAHMRSTVHTEAAGSAWRYVPSTDATPTRPRPTAPVPTRTSTRPSTVVAPVVVDDVEDDDGDVVDVVSVNGTARLFEEVGRIREDVIIRDANGVMYRATKMR